MIGIGTDGAAAQGWTADLYAGATRAQGVATQVTSASLVGNLRYLHPRGSFGYVAVGAPLGEDAALWGAAGFGGRSQWTVRGPFAVGLDVTMDGYAWREGATDTSGRGWAMHSLPFVSATLPVRGLPTLELHGGLHSHDSQGRRDLWELGGRATASLADLAAAADVRWLIGDSARYPFAGAQAVRAFGRGRAWASAGRWLGPLDQTAWEVGASWDVRVGELWASVRQDATDPLYGNPLRRSWNVGFSRPLGRRPGTLPAPVVESGRVRISLEQDAVPEDSAQPVRIAGEFNSWTPAPMARAGADWVLELPLASGVYRFAFVSASGEWFVPEGYPGRMSDDMGGHVAVLVVP